MREMPGQMTISDYGALLREHTPCSEGEVAFSRCRTRKDVFDLIGGPVGVDFFLDSIRAGWGPTPKDFGAVFAPYINGKTTVSTTVGARRVQSQVWCEVDHVSVDDNIRWVVLIGCRGRVTIREWQVVKVFLDKNSSVTLDCAPGSIVYVENYGGEVRSVNGDCKIIEK